MSVLSADPHVSEPKICPAQNLLATRQILGGDRVLGAEGSPPDESCIYCCKGLPVLSIRGTNERAAPATKKHVGELVSLAECTALLRIGDPQSQVASSVRYVGSAVLHAEIAIADSGIVARRRVEQP